MSGAGLLPRAAAMASAREAVRRGRERRAVGARSALGAVSSVSSASSVSAAMREDRTPASTAGAAKEAAKEAAGQAVGEPAVPPPRSHRPDAGAPVPPPAGERMRLALRERLPLWVQLRCGIEPRTLLALAVVLVVALGFAVHHFWAGRPEAVRAPAAERAPEGSTAGEAGAVGGAPGSVKSSGRLPGKRLVVDVGGKVRRPGIYKLPSGARVADALKAAGGVRPGTDVGGLNRARRVVDGEQIVAGAAPAGSGARQGPGGGGTGPGTEPGGGGAAGAAAPGAAAGPVSLSSATAEQLQTLPGVGPVLAQHIVEYRKAHGGFSSVRQLQEVDGIGDSRFADIEPKVSP